MERRDSAIKLYVRQISTAGLALLTAKTVFAPLERAKLVLQSQSISTLPTVEQYTSLRHFLLTAPRKEGLLAYWRGNTANMSKMLVGTAVRFYSYHSIHNLIVIDTDCSALELLIRQFTAGVLAGSLALMFVHPFDVCRTRMALDFSRKGGQRLYFGFIDYSGKTIRDYGIKGYYKGFLISLATVVPHCALSLTLNEQLGKLLPTDPAFSQYFGVGSVSALLTSVLLYPFDTVRRRMQFSSSRGSKVVYTSSKQCLTSLMENEGVRGLYRGIGVQVLRTVPSMALQLACYDWLRSSRGS
jgi:solute carrier family 25 (adenine nucleotide translocator) protein 4/5/6/31